MQFENKMTIGNVLTLIAMIAGMLWTYAQLQTEQARQSDQIAMINGVFRERVLLVDARNLQSETRLRSLEIAQASQSSDLRNIQIGINEIKAGINVLSQKERK